MKKFSIIIIFIFSVLTTNGQIATIQKAEKQSKKDIFNHSVGVQYNPYFDQSFFNGDIKKYVFAVRYIWSNKKGVSFGPELSGNYGHNNAFIWHTINFGAFFRYAFRVKRKISPFLEASAYNQWNKMTVKDSTFINTDNDLNSGIKNNKISYYVAFGISTPLYRRKLTLDFFIKYSTDMFLNGRNFVPSIRIVYHF